MPTVCEIVIELKKKGIKGYTGKKKAELQEMLTSGKTSPKKTSPKKQSKKEEQDSTDYKQQFINFGFLIIK